YDHYALKAFEVNSIDYLLKPVEPEHLERAMNKLEQFRSTRPEWLDRPDFRAVLEELSRTLRDPHIEKLDRVPIQVRHRTPLLHPSPGSPFFPQPRSAHAPSQGKA